MRGLRGPEPHIVCVLPQKVTLKFGKSGTPERKHLNPSFKRRGQDKCLARLKITEYSDDHVVLMLPESLACHGPGRYEVCVMDRCCTPCDCIEVVFEAKCEIVACEVTEVEDCHEQCH